MRHSQGRFPNEPEFFIANLRNVPDGIDIGLILKSSGFSSVCFVSTIFIAGLSPESLLELERRTDFLVDVERDRDLFLRLGRESDLDRLLE